MSRSKKPKHREPKVARHEPVMETRREEPPREEPKTPRPQRTLWDETPIVQGSLIRCPNCGSLRSRVKFNSHYPDRDGFRMSCRTCKSCGQAFRVELK